jgi:hypothetical protein
MEKTDSEPYISICYHICYKSVIWSSTYPHHSIINPSPETNLNTALALAAWLMLLALFITAVTSF